MCVRLQPMLPTMLLLLKHKKNVQNLQLPFPVSFFKFAGGFERRLRLQFEQMIVVVWHLPAGKMAFRFLVTEVLSFSFSVS